jgi:hypothetical protein
MNFKMWRVHHDGATTREHLESIEKRTGQRPKELDEAEIPLEAAHVWAWFCDLHSARSSSGFGPNPISYSEIAAWGKLTGERVRRHEVKLLRQLDTLFLAEAADGKK